MFFLLSMISFATQPTPAQDAQEPKQSAPAENQAPVQGAGEQAAPEVLPPCPPGVECPKEVTWKQVKPISRVDPVFPANAAADNAECKVRFFIDETGQVTSVKIDPSPKCGEAFAASTEEAAMQWRFEPWEAKGAGKQITFVSVIKFQRR